MMRVGGDRSGNAAHEPGGGAADLGGEQLKAAVRGGAFATLATQVVGQLAQLAILALLYRFVSPAEFGLFGLAVPILMFLRLFASAGLHVATVGQADLTREQLGAIFWLNLAAGLATTVVTVLAAPLIARAYDVVELQRLLWVLAATSLAGALAVQQQAVLERRLQFRQLSYYRIVAMLMGGTVALLLAWRGDGVAALVGQMYAELLVLILLCARAGGWPQGRPSFVGASRFVRFGGLFALSSLVLYLVQYGDKLLLGWLVGDRFPALVGFYTQAFNWTMKPVFLLTTPLSGVALAGLARAGPDVAARTSLVFAFNRLAALLLLPVGVGLMIVAPEAIAVVGGEAWLPAGEILRILAATILVQAFINL
ncbi:MAG: oligosaccharide flippase family protein, partial [Planctomycetaceae bacterium]|nr:oligosaccharide flippase family protein [Planctomycetaceae bacterium]